jgi:hypothetical protein
MIHSESQSQTQQLTKDLAVKALRDLLEKIENGQAALLYAESEYFLVDAMHPNGSYFKMQSGVQKLSLIFGPE